MSFGCREKDFAERGLTRSTGGGTSDDGKFLIRFTGETFPIRFFEIGEGMTGEGGGVSGENTSEADEDGEMI